MRKPSRWVAVGTMVVAAFLGGAVTGASGFAKDGNPSAYAPLAQLAQVLVQIENSYVDPVERNKILDGAIKGMTAELDPHSAYMTPKDFKRFNEDTEGSFAGIGVEVDFKNDAITVLAPIPGTPAALAGVESGDRIVAIDNKPLAGLAIPKVIRLMRGPAGTRIRITVKRKGKSEPLSFDIVRKVIQVRSVESKRLLSGIGYLRIKQFQSNTHIELLQEVTALRRSNEGALVGIVLDLRSNPGGLVNEARAVADEFLAAGTIFSTRHRAKTINTATATSGGALAKLPTIVLVNEYSASSSELVAGALQDHKRAAIWGAPTFGKGSIQTIFQLPYGAGLRLTTMRYYTPSGRAIQANGIQPDVLVRYQSDQKKALKPLREGDLDGHLAAEAKPGGNKSRRVLEGVTRPRYRAISKLNPDPRKNDDFALEQAHSHLLKEAGLPALRKKPTNAK
jgi:carboxyl-terminal processing protease